jgi:hypothetical protein
MSEPLRLESRPAIEAEAEVCDERIDVPVPAQWKSDAAFVARALGFKSGGVAAYVRSLIARDLYGSLKKAEILVDKAATMNGRNGG